MKLYFCFSALTIISLLVPLEAAKASAEYNACYDSCLKSAIAKAEQVFPGGGSIWSRSHWSWRKVKVAVKAECLEEQNCDSL